MSINHLRFAAAIVTLLGFAATAAAAKPSPKDALSLTPVQKDVEYDVPEGKETDKCTVDVEKLGGFTGYVVKSDAGQVLRRFLDTNGDNKVDQWCYYKDGIEVYRDIDANFNNKADQYRWLGTAGTRWGIDDDENSRIDAWKTISPEEVTAEVVAALRDRDAARFQRLLLTESELKSLGLSPKQVTELGDKIAAAVKAFAIEAGRQKIVTSKSEWVHFGANKPGIVPAGTDGATKDITVYDNVTAVVETDKKHGQLAIGTLIQVGGTWKLFDLPKNLGGEQAAATPGYFFQASFANRPDTEPAAPMGNVSPELEKLVKDLEQIDKKLAAATTPAEQARLNNERANLLERIIDVAPVGEDRNLWIRQCTETISAAVQAGGFPGGVQRLEALRTKIAAMPDAAELVPYVTLRLIQADYNVELGKADADFAKINKKYQDELKDFVGKYATSPDAAEAMLALAIGSEFDGNTEEALTWFTRITSDFPKSDIAPKAAGAKTRLQSVGKSIPLRGKTLEGKSYDLATEKNKLVLIHYWATWCEPCKQDMDNIKALLAKYGAQGFQPLGVNLDNDPKDAVGYLRGKSLPWPQLYEAGGLEGRFATELGILALPTMILVGKDGRVLNRGIHAGELEAELKKILR